ncbi:MAG: endonuclease [Proteiniphilum sp.]|nr:endonuclease [Proteiniphilum sp.]MDD3331806.1 endonuclease [Proteiniphilum sp.]MDD3555033.1 endonuclease [Proteiniphilum sp.]MDY0181703.1 endonuclease [Proteiniphilum sp.]
MNQRCYNCFALVVLLAFSIPLAAQIPDGYYARAEGMRGAELKSALFRVIREPAVLSYTEIWEAFEATDAHKNDKVWDIYSHEPRGGGATDGFDFRQHRCGSIRKEGDCYNREHLFPRSWFRGTSILESDLFHIYPTDGYVNNRRGNLPFGEVGIMNWESTNGSKVGQNTFGGYSKTVFEPIDEYKGDVARSYFYVVTAYEDHLHRWHSDQLGGDRYPGFSKWSLDLLLKWHREDPVSLKEVRRNEAIYRLQKNRNPYIDYPELVECVWGSSDSTLFCQEAMSDSFRAIEYSPFERWLERVKSLIWIR